LADAQGLLHSRVLPGIQLPVVPRMAGDTAQALAALTGPEPLNLNSAVELTAKIVKKTQ